MARATGARRPRRHLRVENVEPIGAPERGLATWGEWSALGGERAYWGRLGKDRSAYQSRRSIAKREIGFTAGNGSSFLLSFVRIATGGINVGHTRFPLSAGHPRTPPSSRCYDPQIRDPDSNLLFADNGRFQHGDFADHPDPHGGAGLDGPVVSGQVLGCLSIDGRQDLPTE